MAGFIGHTFCWMKWLTDLKSKIEEEVIPTLFQITQTWIEKYDESEDADDHVRQLIDNYEILKEEFSDIDDIRASIKTELIKLEQWVENDIIKKRSIFDDIDD